MARRIVVKEPLLDYSCELGEGSLWVYFGLYVFVRGADVGTKSRINNARDFILWISRIAKSIPMSHPVVYMGSKPLSVDRPH
jgi:hypothetical protein